MMPKYVRTVSIMFGGTNGTTVCPALLSASHVSVTAREHAGCGSKNPSSLKKPYRNVPVAATASSSKGTGGTIGSALNIVVWHQARITVMQSSTCMERGPGADGMTPIEYSIPARRGDLRPTMETRPGVGLKLANPQKWAGMRTDPPMSVPRPTGEPCAAIRAASPPEDPPGVRSWSHGFRVAPHTSLLDSGNIMHWETLVCTKGMAPCSRSMRTTTASAAEGSKQRAALPMVLSMPCRLRQSLTEKGTPCRRPTNPPVASTSSASTAS
mmetsp:Transcript_52536/g.139922  ORF Transcript_52536/g.139922 Transcript_52536/m.139922 type:complete len:269 (-) Transcript_52536:437-1243(-)